MTITTPITITFTEQRVLDYQFERDNDRIIVAVGMVASTGLILRYYLALNKLQRAAVAAKPAVPEVPSVMDGEEVVTPAVPAVPSVPAARAVGGVIQRLAVNTKPSGVQDFFMVESIETGTNDAYQHAKQAMKQADELAALTAAGIADGWLMPGTP